MGTKCAKLSKLEKEFKKENISEQAYESKVQEMQTKYFEEWSSVVGRVMKADLPHLNAGRKKALANIGGCIAKSEEMLADIDK